MTGDTGTRRRDSVLARVRSRVVVTLAIAVALCLATVADLPAGTATPQPDAGNAIVVCAAPDGVLHAAAAAGKCSPGQTSMRLEPSTSEGDDGDPWNPQAEADDASPASLDALGAMDARIKAIENGPLFEVVDKNGRPIFQVFPGKALMKSASGHPFVELRAGDAGGFLTARSLSSQEISIGVSERVGGLLIAEGGQTHVELGKQPAGNVSLRVRGPNGPAAAIGESQAGTGALVVSDQSGRPRALMSVIDGKGSIRIQNAQGEAVLAITEGATRGGLLVIGDATSEPMVKFGVAQDRYGVVLAGPVSGFPLVPGSGLPGSYFLGCAGGDTCGPEGGGQ